ncbi:coumaroyl-CoA:anthocyanidin 3-O-glucoside-6''-O-coumaroyltransferase 1-like [Durio zibethinus]|uniref:Coumaroyl-CoA:anthocyanidin 3-O-glucoside-6''-O-coumaroyltransferase 1-like n=1 Tax=Durio zibethinus TaxID=66656 RepID=A0A6P5XFN4_DURZI|nr:coumaroyl-CoA:anthocyanidin 3-O-glucoside-6''-O-coumaroyltransferase 1-like [Durio zibethinus]
MANGTCIIKVLDHSHVSPPPGSVPNTSLPLTFFDIPWLLCRPMQRLFFYEFPYSTLQFSQTILPSLKTSLSHTLQTFYPFAAKLICPSSSLKPHILYTDGDCVPFTLAESSADFDRTIGYHARDVKDLHPFVPQLPPARVLNKTRVVPLLALQVTVFPNSGICIGATFCHVAADGRSFNHFMKAWASILRSGGNSAACPEKSVPFFDRNLIKEKDPCGLESMFLNEWWTWASDWEEDKLPAHDILAHKVRASFVMDRGVIDRLKRYVLNQCVKKSESEQLRASTFVVTCALVWTCLIKAQELSGSENLEDDEFHYFCFVADCRNRPEFAIPETYFGNCLAICFVRMKRSELLGENGVLAATIAIGNRVGELENGALRGAEKWITNWKEISETGHLVTVSGSPRLRVYETDFGWGKPKKTEVVQIDVSGSICLGECRDEEGGIEISLALHRDEMEVFNGFFEQGLKAI